MKIGLKRVARPEIAVYDHDAGTAVFRADPRGPNRRPTLPYDLETGEADVCRPLTRREAWCLIALSSAAFMVAAAIGIAIWAWGLYAIGMAVFATAGAIAVAGFVDIFRTLRRRR